MSVQCPTCGAEYLTVEAWEALPYVGVQHGVEGDPPIELRNCVACHSTLAVELVEVEVTA